MLKPCPALTVAVQICKLASTSCEAGRWLLAPKARKDAKSRAVDEGDSAKALPWLLWSLELLEGVGGEESRAMQVCPTPPLDAVRADSLRLRKINVLAVLVEAYLDPSAGPSRMEKAEEAIMQLLVSYSSLLLQRSLTLAFVRSAFNRPALFRGGASSFSSLGMQATARLLEVSFMIRLPSYDLPYSPLAFVEASTASPWTEDQGAR